MDDLKKVFDAARKIRGHNLEEAASDMDYSVTTLTKLFSEKLPYPDKPKQAVRKYIYESGLRDSIEKLDLDPDAKKKVAATSQ